MPQNETELVKLLPVYLRSCTVPDVKRSKDGTVFGKIRCVCGCDEMKIRIFAQDSGKYLCVADYHGDTGFRVDAVCVACGKDYLLIDAAKYGYDGYVCHEGTPVEDADLLSYRCHKCGEDRFQAEIGIETEAPEQFMEEVVEDAPDQYRPENFVNAFGWFNLSLTCSHCGKKLKNWIDLETS